MIWIALVAVVFVAGGTWFVAKSAKTRAVVAGLGIAAVAIYWFVGHPDMGDRPLDKRLEQIEAQLKSDPDKVDARGAIAVIEHKIHERPDDPMGYLLVARMYKGVAGNAQAKAMQLNDAGNKEGANSEASVAQDNVDKAEQAFENYVRHGGNDPVALGELADLRFTRTTDVDPATTSLYQAAFAADPQQLRMGYLAGIGLWKQGKTAEAEAIWADVDKRTPPEAPLRQMYAAMRQMFGVDKPASP